MITKEGDCLQYLLDYKDGKIKEYEEKYESAKFKRNNKAGV